MTDPGLSQFETKSQKNLKNQKTMKIVKFRIWEYSCDNKKCIYQHLALAFETNIDILGEIVNLEEIRFWHLSLN